MDIISEMPKTKTKKYKTQRTSLPVAEVQSVETLGQCFCGCGRSPSPGKMYIHGHSLRGPKTEAHKEAIGASVRAYYISKWAAEGGKRCPKCQTYKDVSAYRFRAKTTKLGNPLLRSYCRDCESNAMKEKKISKEQQQKCNWKWRSGITPAVYGEMFERQEGRCAICQRTGEEAKTPTLHVDHCHLTGAIRGLLCAGCNTGIGLFRDDPDVILSAAIYTQQEYAMPEHINSSAKPLEDESRVLLSLLEKSLSGHISPSNLTHAAFIRKRIEAVRSVLPTQEVPGL